MSLQQNQQDIADAEAALQSLGIAQSNFEQALKLLRKRKNAQEDISRIQQHQFYNDAFNLVSQIEGLSASSDRMIAISKFLRLFAEHIASKTIMLHKTYHDATTIVDNILPMESKS